MRQYDPTLISALVDRWVEEQRESTDQRQTHVRTRVYVAGESGAYLIMRGRLYWDEDPADQYFTAAATADFAARAADLREVVIEHGLGYKQPAAFRCYAEFLAAIGLEA